MHILEDMDTEVVRLLASSMVKANKPTQKIPGERGVQAWQAGMSSSTPVLTSVGCVRIHVIQ